jgi:hypothetical protein
MSRRMITQKDQDYIKTLAVAISADTEGNVKVTGYQNTGNYYEQDIAFPSESGYATSFGKIRIKDGRLDVVLCGSGTASSPSSILNYDISVPPEVMANVFPASGEAIGFVSATQCWQYTTVGVADHTVAILIKQNATTLRITFLGFSSSTLIGIRVAFSLLV